MLKTATRAALAMIVSCAPAIADAPSNRPAKRVYSKTLTFTLSTTTPSRPGKRLKAASAGKRDAVPRYNFEQAWPRK